MKRPFPQDWFVEFLATSGMEKKYQEMVHDTFSDDKPDHRFLEFMNMYMKVYGQGDNWRDFIIGMHAGLLLSRVRFNTERMRVFIRALKEVISKDLEASGKKI